MELIETIKEVHRNLLPGYLGIELIEASAENVVGSLEIKEHHCTIGEIVHGGVIMSLADTMGAICAFLNLPQNSKTSTIESKTNLIRPGKLGDTIIARTRLLNKGRTLMLCYSEVYNSKDQLLSVVIQSQIIISTVGKDK
jgi:uncharacterized protein (TIGR00369 family)